MKKISLLIIFVLLLTGCGGALENDTNTTTPNQDADNKTDIQPSDPRYSYEHKGLRLYSPSLLAKDYKLDQVDDAVFNALPEDKKLLVANKLLSGLFFGYPLPILKEKINSGNFISTIQNELKENKNNRSEIEEHLQDKEFFYFNRYANDEVNTILARFFVMQHLDKYFLENWISYILTQTIMFSPAFELPSAHEPNTERVYSSLVYNLQDQSTIAYTTYLHMMSNDNWRRFRSPEDNGREMLEIFILNFDDSLVPKAATALQNWRLDLDNDTLVVGLNENSKPISMFDTTIFSGEDFYRELAKSKDLTKGVTTRIVNYLFTNSDEAKKTQIINAIVSSNPQTWEDILVQIIFSKAFLLESDRAKSAEELYFSLTKQIEYKHYNRSFYNLRRALDSMGQSTMRYKLGKLKRVPLDTLSFMSYHKFIRQYVMIRILNKNKLDSNSYSGSNASGWKPEFVADDRFTISEDSPKDTVKSFVTYLFEAIISRKPTEAELTLFTNHFLNDKLEYDSSNFNLQDPTRRVDPTTIVLDYISRLSELYRYKKAI